MSETYTAEEYRDVLNGILDMDVIEREKAFGVSKPALKYVTDCPALEIIEKYRAYKTAPKVGEYWKGKENGVMVVVRYVEENVVHIYCCDGGYGNYFSYKYFVGNFTRTEHKSKYLESFLSEMKEVSK